MSSVRIVDVVDREGFDRIPPCADRGFDHRSCDYWEDDRRGSKAIRLSWLEGPAPSDEPRGPPAGNPFPPASGPGCNPFDPPAGPAGRGAGPHRDPVRAADA